MKLPDNSQLLQEEYWVMQDPWRIEWEKGVQVMNRFFIVRKIEDCGLISLYILGSC